MNRPATETVRLTPLYEMSPHMLVQARALEEAGYVYFDPAEAVLAERARMTADEKPPSWFDRFDNTMAVPEIDEPPVNPMWLFVVLFALLGALGVAGVVATRSAIAWGPVVLQGGGCAGVLAYFLVRRRRQGP